MMLPPNQREVFSRPASVWVRLRSKGENRGQSKNRMKTNEKRLTANTSQIHFFGWSGNAL